MGTSFRHLHGDDLFPVDEKTPEVAFRHKVSLESLWLDNLPR